jgi:hypothetical protein
LQHIILFDLQHSHWGKLWFNIKGSFFSSAHLPELAPF